MVRLLGGVAGDLTSLPAARLAVLPGSPRMTLVERADWLCSTVAEFLDMPVAEAQSGAGVGRDTPCHS